MDFLLTPAEVWLQWKTYLLNDELPQYVDYIKVDANERRVNNKQQLYLPEVEKNKYKNNQNRTTPERLPESRQVISAGRLW